MNKLLFEGIGTAASSLSPGPLVQSGKLLGFLMWHLLPSRRILSVKAIKFHLDKNPKEARNIAYCSFLHSGRSFMELFLNRKIDYRYLSSNIEITRPDNIYFIRKQRRPIIAVTAHLGSWELLSSMLRLYFPDRPAQITVDQPKNQGLASLLTHYRKHWGIEIVDNRQAAPKILRCLKKNGISAFLVDQNTKRSKSIFLPFLGQNASVNVGPAVLALRTKALVWPIFMVRSPKKSRQYTLIPLDPLDTSELKGAKQQNIADIAAFYTECVENMVRNYPDQWFWMHRRWKTRPKKEKDILPASIHAHIRQ